MNEATTLMSNAAVLRGIILNDAIYIERLIDEFLSRYFCGNDPDKKRDLMELIICEPLNFDIKRLAFIEIVKKEYQDFLIKNPSFKSDIDSIMKDRNILAHWLLDTSENGTTAMSRGEIMFVRFKVKTEKAVNTKIFDQGKIDELKDKIKAVVNGLSELLISMGPSNSASGAASEPS